MNSWLSAKKYAGFVQKNVANMTMSIVKNVLSSALNALKHAMRTIMELLN